MRFSWQVFNLPFIFLIMTTPHLSIIHFIINSLRQRQAQNCELAEAEDAILVRLNNLQQPSPPTGETLLWLNRLYYQTLLEENAVPAGIYQHYKGQQYEVIGLACHSETEEPLVVYRALYGNYGLWVRPASMFLETIALAATTEAGDAHEQEMARFTLKHAFGTPN